MKRKTVVKAKLDNLRWMTRSLPENYRKWGRFLVLFQLIFFMLITNIFSEPMVGKNFRAENDASWALTRSKINFLKEFEYFKLGFLAHYIKRGETLYRISRNYFVSLEELTAVNKVNDPKQLKVGQKIFIPAVNKGATFLQKITVNSSQTLNQLQQKYLLETWQLQRLNPALNMAAINSPTVIYLPRYVMTHTSPAWLNKSVKLIVPVRGNISSRYGYRWGRMHYGLDLAAPFGTQIKAAASGKVTFTGWNGGYGLLIKINHGNFTTFYGHLSRILVKSGSLVEQGQIIGFVGATGRAYGSHLHFEVESHGKKVNPINYILRK